MYGSIFSKTKQSFSKGVLGVTIEDAKPSYMEPKMRSEAQMQPVIKKEEKRS